MRYYMARLWTGRQRNGCFSAGRNNRFVFSQSVQMCADDHLSPIQCVPVKPSLRVKRKGREADRSLPTSVKIQNEWSRISIPPYAFTACTRRILHLPYIIIVYQFFPLPLYYWRNSPRHSLVRRSKCVVPAR